MARSLPVMVAALVIGCIVVVAGGCGTEDGTRADVALDDTTAPDDGDIALETESDAIIEAPPPPLNADPTTRGTEFWVGFAENLSLASNGPPEFAFFVSAREATLGHVEVPRTGYSQAFQVGAGEVVKVAMPAGILYPQIDEVASKLGVRITADRPIAVVAVHYRIYFSEASRILPLGELGDEYVAVTAVDVQGQSPSSLVVVATEDDTTFELVPSTVTTGFLPTGVTQRFLLARGETMQFQAGGDLSGTRVKALGGKRIAVFAGARQANIACVGADSHLWDQMIPVARWGTRHVVLPLGGAGATPVKLVANRFKTAVELSCQDSRLVNPGPGDIIAIAKPTVITSNEPIGVALLVKSNSCMQELLGDPNLLVVPPLGLVTNEVAWTAVADFDTLEHARHRVNVLAKSADTVSLDGHALTSLAPLEGHPELAWAAIEVAAGDHRLSSTGALQATMYGLAPYEAYSFSSGWDCVSAGDGARCDLLGAVEAEQGCDPGDLVLTTGGTRVGGGDGGDDDPDPKACTNACECYERHGDPVVACEGSEAVWACESLCVPTCGLPCEACVERFPTPDGRCE